MKSEFLKFSSKRILFSTMIASALLTGVPQSGRAETGEVQTAMQAATVKGLVVDANGEPLPKVSINKGEKSFPVMLTSFTIVHKETKEKIPYDDYKRMSAEEQKEYNVYPKLNVYQVFNVAQTNLKEARPELYAKLEAENKPEKALVQEGDMYSFPAVDKMFKEQKWICPINIERQDNAFYSISRNQITIPEKSQFKDGES